MSTKVQLSLDYNAIGKHIFRSEGMRSMLDDKVQGIRERCGHGYGCKTFMAGTRYVGRVQANTKDAKRDNLNNNTLLRNMY